MKINRKTCRRVKNISYQKNRVMIAQQRLQAAALGLQPLQVNSGLLQPSNDFSQRKLASRIPVPAANIRRSPDHSILDAEADVHNAVYNAVNYVGTDLGTIAHALHFVAWLKVADFRRHKFAYFSNSGFVIREALSTWPANKADSFGGRNPHLILLDFEAGHGSNLCHKVQVVTEHRVVGIPAHVLDVKVERATRKHPVRSFWPWKIKKYCFYVTCIYLRI